MKYIEPDNLRSVTQHRGGNWVDKGTVIKLLNFNGDYLREVSLA